MSQDINKRLTFLTDLIKTGQFDSQESLLAELKDNNFEVTQTTLSRDLQKIGAYKYKGVYVIQKIDFDFKKVGQFKSIEYCPPNLIVIITIPGLAQATALFIDKAQIKGVAGTITGDDTIFVAISEPENHKAIIEQLNTILSD